MIKRRTKRQQQKGRKEPKAKRKLNKRMLKKKTTLKTEIPKLMRYFSCTEAGSRARCAGSAAAGAVLGSRGWGGHCHTEHRAALVPAQGEPAGMPSPCCPVLEPFTGAVCWPWSLSGPTHSSGQALGNSGAPTSSPCSPELTLHIPSGLLGSSAAQHGLVLRQKSGFEFCTIL